MSYVSVMIKEKSSEDPAPIFVVGAPRSGTTLTAKILGRHSRVFMPGETHFFDDIYARRHELGDLRSVKSLERVIARLKTLYGRYNEDPDQQRVEALFQNAGIIEQLFSCRSYGTMLSRFMEIQMRLSGKVRWGNNVPKDVFYLTEIVSLFPEAKIILCIRDVKDFLVSYQNKWKVGSADNAKRLRRLYHPVLTTLVWQASAKQISRAKQKLPPTQFLLLKYESLVENPEKVVRELCAFIREDFERGMLDIDEGNSSFREGQVGIYASSLGRWKRMLSDEEVFIAQKLGGNRLKEFGYASTPVRINPFKVAYMCATFPYALWRAVQSNKAISGPILPYMLRRLTALGQ